MNQLPQQIYQQQMYQQIPIPEQQQSDLVIVKTMIEHYLQFYFTYEQIVAELEKRGIPQNLSMVVLNSLIMQNRNYFTAYEIRVNLNNQIERFNDFITKHFQITAQQYLSMDMSQNTQPQLAFSTNDIQTDYNSNGFVNGFGNDGNAGM